MKSFLGFSDAPTLADRVREVLRNDAGAYLTMAQIEQRSGLTRRQVNMALFSLRTSGHVERLIERNARGLSSGQAYRYRPRPM